MSQRLIKLAAVWAVAVVAVAFLGWQLLGYVEEVWGPEANPFALKRPLVPQRPAVQVAEIAPLQAGIPRQPVAYASPSADVPGWRVQANGPKPEAGAAADPAALPWRGSDKPLWRQPLGGQGNSSPIIIGERIFFTIADGGPTLWLVCFNLTNGFGVWRQPVSREPFPSRHEKTSDAASTPCSDGSRLFVAHAAAGSLSLTAFGLDGTPLWKTPLGSFEARWGFTSSPAWQDGLVVVGAENADTGFLAAVDAETGRIIWRRRRPRSGDESYSSPVVCVSAQDGTGRTEVVMAGLERVEAYALDDGRSTWGSGGISSTSGATPAIIGDICVATSGYPARSMVALRIEPSGGSPAVLWKEDRDSEIPYVPSPLVHDRRLYVVHDDGVAHCRDLATGKVAWKRRVGGAFSASPVIVNGELLCADEQGRCTIVGLADGKVQHTFSLTGGCFATPVVVRERLVVRTTEELVCFDLSGMSDLSGNSSAE